MRGATAPGPVDERTGQTLELNGLTACLTLRLRWSVGHDAPLARRVVAQSRPVAPRVGALPSRDSSRKQCGNGARPAGVDRTFPARRLGFGLALARGDLFFAAVFGSASAMTIIETMRRR
jgi:hypothetical protein